MLQFYYTWFILDLYFLYKSLRKPIETDFKIPPSPLELHSGPTFRIIIAINVNIWSVNCLFHSTNLFFAIKAWKHQLNLWMFVSTILGQLANMSPSCLDWLHLLEPLLFIGFSWQISYTKLENSPMVKLFLFFYSFYLWFNEVNWLYEINVQKAFL